MRFAASIRLVAGAVAMTGALAACGGSGDHPAPAPEADSAPASTVAETKATAEWFTIDEEAGTVTNEDGTYPIGVRGTLSVDGVDYDFVSITCPIRQSEEGYHTANFVGYGFAPDGRPFYFNGAGDLAFNITYDPDWRSTNTVFDEFNPDWSISDSEMRIDEFEVKEPDTGERVPASIVVTCL